MTDLTRRQSLQWAAGTALLLPALAKVKIYTTSGRLLKELEADSTGQI